MTETTTTRGYTEEELKELFTEYKKRPTRETIEFFSKKFGRNIRSITAKLSHAGIYIKQPYRTKLGERPHTKYDLVDIIADLMGEDSSMLEGLEKAPKNVLRKIALALDPEALDELKN